MKVVIDTNVFISGVFFTGAPYQVLQAWRDKKIQLVITMDIYAEHQKVADIFSQERPGIDLSRILDYLLKNAALFESTTLPDKVCSDPDDDKFITCAIASGSKLIISGDKHLLRVSGFQDIEVLKPREFLIKYITD